MERQALTRSQGHRRATKRMKSEPARIAKRRKKKAKDTPKVRLCENNKTPHRPIRK
jgi:hypothetical protein